MLSSRIKPAFLLRKQSIGLAGVFLLNQNGAPNVEMLDVTKAKYLDGLKRANHVLSFDKRHANFYKRP